MVKNFFIFIVGVVILSPIIAFGLSDSIFGFVCACVWAVIVFASTIVFPRFWKKWWKINADYAAILEGRK